MKFYKVFLAALLAVIAGSVVTFLFWLCMLFGFAGSMGGSPVVVEKHSILTVDMAELITDAPVRNPFANFDILSMTQTSTVSLYDVLRAIDAAKGDDRIEGIYLRFDGQGGVTSTAILEELREALADFRQSGKFIVAYDDTYSQGDYYLATVADKIYLQPEGMVDWHGVAVTSPFFKGLFDKLGIKAEVFRPTACKYKSAVEPYFLEKMSDANREQTRAFIGSMWDYMQTVVAQARGMEVERLQQLTDELASVLPADALSNGFVDGLIYEDQMDDVFADYGVESDDAGYRYVTLGEYVSQLGSDLKNFSADRVAIVYADGAIYDGSGDDQAVYGNDLAATLAEVRKDEGIKAVVLRVNSPGGSALASDVIWREMELLKAEKPVIVSMGGYAASGGYYISCPADAILADRTTLTGSIGVYGCMLQGEEMFRNKLGITFDGVKSNASADMGQNAYGLQIRPLSAAERSLMLRSVDKIYESFTSKVAAGRNLSVEKVLDIAGGRVWSGVDALGIGLIDSYGGLKEAIGVAVDKAGLTEYRVEEIEEELTGVAAFFASFNAQVRTAIKASQLGVLPAQYDYVSKHIPQNGMIMYSPYEIDF